MFDTGYLTVARLRGAPIRFHWSAPLGAVLFGGLAFVPGFWLGFLVLILSHELGHATLVSRRGLRTFSVDVHGFGGVCRYDGAATERDRAVIAWGGVLAQLLVLALTFAAVLALGEPQSAFGFDLVSALTRTNLILIGLNLLPFRPLDGAQAWRVFRRGGGSGRRERKPRGPRKEAPRRSAGPRSEDADEVVDSVRRALRDAAKDARKGDIRGGNGES